MASSVSGDDPSIEHLELIRDTVSEALQTQLERFRAIERKVWRHAALLGVLGGSGFVVGYRRALSVLQGATGLWEILFAISYLSLLAASLVGLFFFVLAMDFGRLRTTPPVEQGFVQEYGRKEHEQTLVALSKGAETAREENKPVLRRKIRWAKRGWQALRVAVVVAAASVSFYLLITSSS